MIINKKPEKRGDIKRVITKDIDGSFARFSDTLKDENFNLDIFYRNIKSVNIIPATKKDMTSGSVVAEYDLFNNCIRYLRDSFKIGIFHELFHLASTIMGKRILYSGFFQMDMKTKRFIGLGLNEGFTTILDERYFGSDEKKEVLGKSYYVLKYFVQMIEEAMSDNEYEDFLYSLKEQLKHPMIIGKYLKRRSQTISDEEFDLLVKDTMKKSLKKYT